MTIQQHVTIARKFHRIAMRKGDTYAGKMARFTCRVHMKCARQLRNPERSPAF